MTIKYEEDFYAWTIEQSNMLRDKNINQLDFENLIDEIETLGRDIKHKLSDEFASIISNLLMWEYKPNLRYKSVQLDAEYNRKKVMFYLKDNPSLIKKTKEILDFAYKIGVLKAAKETLLEKEDFPLECPYTFDQIIDNGFYPS